MAEPTAADLSTQGRTRGDRADETVAYDRLFARVDDLRNEFTTAKPYPIVVVDDFLTPESAARVCETFPQLGDDGWINYIRPNERTYGMRDRRSIPAESASVLDELNSDRFLSLLTDITGISRLEADHSLEGAGLHLSDHGGFLNVHTDFNVHPHRPNWRRQLNLLVYLNPNWDESWGGHLEFWDARVERRVRSVAPLFNRAVLFLTNERSFHGFPDRLDCPPDVTRKSLALYYFTEEEEPPRVRCTNHRARPGDGFTKRCLIALDRNMLSVYDHTKRALGFDDTAVSNLLLWLSKRFSSAQARGRPRVEPSRSAGKERTRCPVCCSDDSRVYVGDKYSIGPKRFDMVRCRCGMVFVEPRPDAASRAALYADPGYFEDGYSLGVEGAGYFERRDELLTAYERTARELLIETGKAGGELLEIGAAGGFFLEAARRAGMHACGVEISPSAAAYARREFGLDVFCGGLENAGLGDARFDIVYADNVLEHTEDPLATLTQVRRVLRADGYVVVIVPSYVNSVYFRALRRCRRLFPPRTVGTKLARMLKVYDDDGGAPPYHLQEFDRRTISDLLRRAGFETVSVQGSIPTPAYLSRSENLGPRDRVLLGAFRVLGRLMRGGWIPGATLRILARPHEPRAVV